MMLRLLVASAFVALLSACPPGPTTFECCIDGMIDECECPAGAACARPEYADCGDGTCIDGEGAECDAGDAGTADAG